VRWIVAKCPVTILIRMAHSLPAHRRMSTAEQEHIIALGGVWRITSSGNAVVVQFELLHSAIGSAPIVSLLGCNTFRDANDGHA
jgi:hypothetical protein